MLREFNSFDDLARNFNNTLVDYKGVVYLAKPREDITLGLYKFKPEGGWNARCSVVIDFNGKDKDAKLLCPKLGFFMYAGHLYHLTRSCRRQWQFGANINNVSGWYWSKDRSGSYHRFAADMGRHMLFDTDLVQQISSRNNIYNPVLEVQVLSSDFAVAGDNLLFQGATLGHKADKPTEFTVAPELYDSLLVKQLEKHGVNVR
jgi:hypothetical protein